MTYRPRATAALLALIFGPGCGHQDTPPNPVAPAVKTAAEPPHPVADMVLIGGTVRTQNPDQPRATAVALKSGRIVAVGDDATIRRWIGDSTQTIGLRGRTVVPGLVDAHMHLFGLGRRKATLDLVGTETIEEVKSKLARAVRRASPGDWIQGRGWDQNDWPGQRGRYPTARDLDGVSPDNPVVLTRIDGHALWANSRALKAAGVNRKTRAPRGGQIIKRRGRPTGVFVDNAMSLMRGHVPPMSRVQLRRAALLGQNECLKVGLTQVHDMGIGPTELRILRALDKSGDLKLRVYAMLDGSVEDLSKLFEDGPQIPDEDGPSRLTVRGVKFYVDGALGSRGAALYDPYSDDPKNSGLVVMDLDFLEARIRTARDLGFQVATHAIGDRGNGLVLDIYERVFAGDSWRARPRVEHAQILRLQDVLRFGQSGIIASMQPTHATSDMPWAEARVGAGRIKGAYAWQSLLTTSATIAAGSDAPVEEISPFAGLYSASTRKDQLGFPRAGWFPSETMTSTQALAAFTSGGAWASFRENDAGMIAEGFVADLTVVNMDPIGAAPTELLGARAELTIVSGQIAFMRPGADRPPAPPSAPKAKPTPVPKRPRAEPPQPAPAPAPTPGPVPAKPPARQPSTPTMTPAPAPATQPASVPVPKTAEAPAARTSTTATSTRTARPTGGSSPKRGPTLFRY